MFIQISVIDITEIKPLLYNHPIIITPYHPEIITELEKEYLIEEMLTFIVNDYIKNHYYIEILDVPCTYIWNDSPHYRDAYLLVKNHLDRYLQLELPKKIGNRAYAKTLILNNNLHIVIKGTIEIF